MAAIVSQILLPSCRVSAEAKLDSSSYVNGSASSCSSSSVVFSRHSPRLERGRRLDIPFLCGTRVLFSRRCGWTRCGKPCRRSGEVFAKGTDDSFSTGEMTLETALKLLGVGQGATFDEILDAKKTLVTGSGGDQDRISQLEAAYDTLLMQSLSQRRSGKVLDSTIRYADVRKAKSFASGGVQWLKGALPKSSPVALETPVLDTVVLQTGVFGALFVWTFVTGLSSSPAAIASGADTPGFILALGFGASLYFLRKQNLKLGKATLVTVGGLVTGAVVGGLVESWLRVDIVPLLGIASPDIVVSEFVLVFLYLTSLYLR